MAVEGSELRLLFFRLLCKQEQCNALTDPHSRAKQTQAKWSYTTLRVPAWSPAPHSPPLTDPPLSLRPESVPWPQSRRSVFVLTYASHRPPASCVCATATTPLCPMACCIPPVSVYVCMYAVEGGGSWQAVPSRVSNSSWRVSRPHSHVKMHACSFGLRQ